MTALNSHAPIEVSVTGNSFGEFKRQVEGIALVRAAVARGDIDAIFICLERINHANERAIESKHPAQGEAGSLGHGNIDLGGVKHRIGRYAKLKGGGARAASKSGGCRNGDKTVLDLGCGARGDCRFDIDGEFRRRDLARDKHNLRVRPGCALEYLELGGRKTDLADIRGSVMRRNGEGDDVVIETPARRQGDRIADDGNLFFRLGNAVLRNGDREELE